jgi:hypothetical protein
MKRKGMVGSMMFVQLQKLDFVEAPTNIVLIAEEAQKIDDDYIVKWSKTKQNRHHDKAHHLILIIFPGSLRSATAIKIHQLNSEAEENPQN